MVSSGVSETNPSPLTDEARPGLGRSAWATPLGMIHAAIMTKATRSHRFTRICALNGSTTQAPGDGSPDPTLQHTRPLHNLQLSITITWKLTHAGNLSSK